MTIDEGRKFKMEKKFPYSSVKEREGRFTYDDVCGFNQIVVILLRCREPVASSSSIDILVNF